MMSLSGWTPCMGYLDWFRKKYDNKVHETQTFEMKKPGGHQIPSTSQYFPYDLSITGFVQYFQNKIP